jgi:type VI secretion system secreted protein VgrG
VRRVPRSALMAEATMARVMEVTTPLGEDVLLFHGMHARDEISRVPEFRLDLLSADGEINMDDILGKNVAVKVSLADDSTRYFNGFVSRFSQGRMFGRYHQYQAVVRPWLWFLSRTADCRIFQEMTVPDIVKAVFRDHPIADVKWELTGSYRKWNYCVQYRETDLNFVSRLLEHEGIYYYFKYTGTQNTLILTDSYSGHSTFAGTELLPFIDPERLVRGDTENVATWDFGREVQPGVYVHDDYDLERPSVELKSQKSVARKHQQANYEVYDYPGLYLQKADGEQYASVRIDEYGTQFETAMGTTNARGLSVGYLFTLDRHPRADQNCEHLVIAASYELEFSDYESMPERTGASFRCSFVAMSSKQQFRPLRSTPKPFVQGPQTAMVVGPAGEEIFTDKYGRVKVQFHWDRLGKKDENSSCWIRVSSPWAGKGWGGVSTPRIGQEVVVDFLEGDPDQPIITGRVYNAESQPPFGFPAGAVISGVKSQTHKGAGYNEFSLDDTAGKEKITVHGQYDMNSVIEHDQTLTVHNNRTDRIDVNDSESVGKNQKWDVGVNRDATIGSNETLKVGANRTKNVGANETISVGGNRSSTVSGNETATVALARTHAVGINESINVGAAQEITVGGLQALTVGAAQTITVGANQTNTIGSNQTTTVGKNLSTTVGADESRKVAGGRVNDIGKDDSTKVAKNFVVDAGDQITLKTGDASIMMKKDGTIVIKGKDIQLEGSGKINVKASSDVVIKGSKVGVN